MGNPRRKLLVPTAKRLILPRGFARRPIPRPAPWVWVPQRVIRPHAGVAFVSSGNADNGVTSSLAFSTTFNIGTVTANGALVIWLVVGSSTATSLSITWNGVSMFNVANTTVSNAGQTIQFTLFGLINPASGSNSAAASWATTNSLSMMGFWSFTGADQSANSTTFINGTTVAVAGNHSSQSGSVTTANGDATVFAWGTGQDPTGVSGNTPTPDWINTTFGANAGTFGEGQHTLSTTSSDSYSAATTVADFMMGCGCRIKQSSGAADVLQSQSVM